jgi:hypothetical protein
MTSMHRLVGALLAAAAMAVGALAPAAPAGAEAPAAPAQLTLQAAPPADDPSAVVLTARLLGPDGQPLGNAAVTFFVRSDDFGGVAVRVASATTDAAGYARVRYAPTWRGPQDVTARFDGGAGVGPAQAATRFVAQAVAPAYRPEPAPLAGVRRGVSWAAATVGVGVWVLLLGVLVRVVRELPRAAQRIEASARIPGAAALTEREHAL